MKKFDAFGRFSARSVVADEGFEMIWAAEEAAPDEKVVMRKTWVTWKAMYQDWVLSSTPARVT